MNNKNINLRILRKNLNRKYKLIFLKKKLGNFTYFKNYPSYFREWNNTIYSYNKNYIKDLPINTLRINQIITNYFNLYFKNNEFLKSKYVNRKKMRFLLKKIYISKTNIKHINSKAIITLYIINIGEKALYKKYKEAKIILKKVIDIYINIYKYFKLRRFILLYWSLNKKQFITNKSFLNIYTEYNNIKYILSKYLIYSSNLINILQKNFEIIRKYQYLYFLNKLKLNNNFFISKLSNKLSKILNKKIEFNLINLKSLTSNSDIFTKVLSLKLRKRKTPNVLKNIITIVNKGKFPKINRKLEKERFNIEINRNKHKYINIIDYIMLKKDLNKLLKKLYSNIELIKISNITKLYFNEKNKKYKNKRNDIIFNSISYKNLSGIKLEVKGRLTKRYRADRSIYKLYSKGTLNNIDSSLKNLSSVTFRGHLNSNLAYSISKSKRRIGAFAVKGWISGR